MAQFCFSSNSQMEIRSIKFFSVKSRGVQILASLCIKPYANASKQFYDSFIQCLAS